MKIRSIVLIGTGLFSAGILSAQQTEQQPPNGFWTETPIRLSFQADIRALKEDTNDSVHIKTDVVFGEEGSPDTLQAQVRARGQFRRKTCYFPPLTLRFSKADRVKATLAGQRELKLVLPCKVGKPAEDLVLKEMLAYRIFEAISPFHYSTRQALVEIEVLRGQRIQKHTLSGFLLEDHGGVARRYDGRRVRRQLPAQMQDGYYSVLNNLFQFLIGHTDFSIGLQHNQRLYYIGERYLSIPYDFDMSGLVDAPYAAVSNTQTLRGSVADVSQRIYKGFRRDTALIQKARRQILDARPRCLEILEGLQESFHDPITYRRVRAYIEDGFAILERDRSFKRYILAHLRE